MRIQEMYFLCLMRSKFSDSPINSDDFIRILEKSGAKNVPKAITDKEELKTKLKVRLKDQGYNEEMIKSILSS